MTTETPTIKYKIGNERLISVTENAARKLASLLKEKGQPEGALRLKVVGGGCSGFSYSMQFENAAGMMDKVFDMDGLKVFVDATSVM